MTALHALTAGELLAGYRAGRFSPLEVAQALLAHITRWEPHIHATWGFDAEAMLAQARVSEARWQRGEPAGALDGVPVTLKENIATRGVPVPLGSAATELVPATEDAPPAARTLGASVDAPVQQGLANGSPDVDAVWRLTQDRPFDFETRPPVVLTEGQWCPFNTQSTWWWPRAFPLLYVPSHCSFRMCDIWKSFVAQRCLWALGAGVVFHAPEVVQERNPHDYLRDFHDEVPGYLQNTRIADILTGLDLAAGEAAVADNLLACYDALIREKIFPPAEWPLVQAWIKDCAAAA